MKTTRNSTSRHLLTASAALLCAFTTTLPAPASAPLYTVTVLDGLGGTGAGSVASRTYGINATGQVTGYSYASGNGQGSVAVIWTGTSPTSLLSATGLGSSGDNIGYSINAAGQVARGDRRFGGAVDGDHARYPR